MATAPWTDRLEHQRGRRADRAGARHDPHVGAAPRLPRARSARASGYRRYEQDDVETLRRARAHRHRGLSVSAALERARETGGGLDHPSHLRRRRRDRPRRAPAGPAQVDAGRAVAGDRARGARARRRAGALRGLPARALLPRARAALPPARARTPTRRRSSPTSPALRRPRARRSRSRSPTATRWATSGRSIVDAPGYAACLLAWEQPGVTEPGGAARRRPALRGDLDHRPARDPPRRAGRRAAGRPRRPGVRRAARGAAGRPAAGAGAARARADGADQPHAGLPRGRRRRLRPARRRPRSPAARRPRRAVTIAKRVGAEHRAELVRALRAGRRRRGRRRRRTRTHSSRSGWRGIASASRATMRARARAARPAARRAPGRAKSMKVTIAETGLPGRPKTSVPSRRAEPRRPPRAQRDAPEDLVDAERRRARA